MKTNVTMVSHGSRELYGVVIRQNTKDSFLSLTDLQEAYTHARLENGWHDRQISDIFRQESNVERIYYLLKEQGLLKDDFDFFKDVNEVGLIKVLKKLNVYKCYGRGDKKIVFCNKNLWLLICQELSPIFYADVIQYLFIGHFSVFDFVPFDCGEYEMVQQERLNHEKAWRYFYPEGDGKCKPGYCLHHINPDWRYNDVERYRSWNPEDLQMVTNSEHWKIHHKIGFGRSKDIEYSDACDLNNSLRRAIASNIPCPDYAGINRALNIKVFGHHETGMRNLASEEELKRLNTLQENIAFCIQRGYLNDNASIIKEIQR